MDENKEVQFLKDTLGNILDKPESIVIKRTIDEMGVLLTLTVDGSDMGKLIGREGNTAKAIRTLLMIVGLRQNCKVSLKITEPDGTYKYGKQT